VEEPLAALKCCWANLIRLAYEVDPRACRRCGAEMRVRGFITEPKVIERTFEPW